MIEDIISKAIEKGIDRIFEILTMIFVLVQWGALIFAPEWFADPIYFKKTVITMLIFIFIRQKSSLDE